MKVVWKPRTALAAVAIVVLGTVSLLAGLAYIDHVAALDVGGQ